MDRLEARQIMRDFLGDVVMDISAAVNLGGEECDWEEAAEYCQGAIERLRAMQVFCVTRQGEQEKSHGS